MLKLQKCKFLFASFLLCLGLTACGEDGDVELLEVEADADDVESANRVLSEYDADAHRIENFDVLNTVTITWDGASATIDKSVKNVSIAVDGGSVTVRSSAEGIEYVLAGASDNGNIKFYSDHGFKLTLNGVDLTSQTSAVINNQGKKNCFVYLPGGTKSYMTDAEIYSDSVAGEDCKGCFFSEGQIIVCGTGEINVVGRRKHGIATDDYLVVNDDATVNVHTSIKDAIHTNDFVQFERGRITIVSSQADGIDCGGAMALLGGTIDIHTSAPTGKCIKCGGDVTMNDGTLLLNNSADAVWTSGTGDDADYSRSVCLKTKGSLHMNGGEVTAESSGLSCRGIFVMRDFNMAGGEINVATSGAAYQYDTVCDYTVATGVKVKGDMLVTGGMITSSVSGSGSKSILVKGNYTQSGGFVRGSSTGVTLGKTETIKKKPEEMTDDEMSSETGGTTTSDAAYTPKASAKGIKVKGVMTVRGGRLYGYSATNEAIEVKNLIDISGGEVFAHSDSDDGLNAASHITISGGYVCGYTLGNDGIDANGNINVDGGVIFAVCKRKPEMALDANSEGGYKLYVNGGTLITVGPLESGAEMAQECFSAASYTYGMTYGVKVGSDTYVFTAPTSSQAGSGIVVSGAEKPVLLEGVTVTGGTTVFDGVAALVVNGNVTGGTEVVLESYVPEESGPGAGGGSGGGGGGSGEKPSHKPDSKPDSTSTTTATTESVPLLLSSF